MKRIARGTIGMAMAVLIGACGGGSSAGDDEAAIERTWSEFIAAAREQDGAGACAELSAALAEPDGIPRQLSVPPEPVPGIEGCEDLLSQPSITTTFTIDAADELETVEVDGSTASGTAGAAEPTFVLEDGEWKVSGLYGAPVP